MTPIRTPWWTRLAAALLACAGAMSCATASAATDVLDLPGSWVGTLPCADCAGVAWHLDLWPDGVFHLRRTWQGPTPTIRDDIGRYTLDGQRRRLVLRGGAEMPLELDVVGSRTLRPVDPGGDRDDPALHRELTRLGRLDPTPIEMFMGGEMRYLADAASFVECLTGRRYPIAMEGDYLSLERAYRGAVSEGGAPLYVTFDGSLVERPKMEGDGTEPTIVVRRFVGTWPGHACERSRADSTLVNTYWRVVSLRGEQVQTPDHGREAHLVLAADGARYRATAGCNSMTGTYTIDGPRLEFGPAAATRMACPGAPAEAERKLAAALAAAHTWRIEGQTLELRDGAGNDVALLEAVYLR